MLVEGGELTVTSQDDGIKGVQVLIGGGTVDVAGSDEALEGSLIVIDDGDVELHAADDGVNAASSDDSASTDGQPGGAMAADDSLALYVNGGTLEVWASGDGLDSNGSATITGGEITVYGPTTDGNGALDVNGTFDVSGGTLMATGSAGMMVAPSTDSAQGWIATALGTTAAAGSEVVITDADGAEVAAYTIQKDFASVVYSSADIEPGATYTVTVDGTATTVTAGEAPAGGTAARWAADVRSPRSPLHSHHVTRRNPDERQPAPARPRHPAGRAQRRTPSPLPPRRTWRRPASPAGSPRAAGRSPRAPSSRASRSAAPASGPGTPSATTARPTPPPRRPAPTGTAASPAIGRGPMGDLEGQVPAVGGMGGPPGDLTQGEGGTTDQAPDFDGDGQPDTDDDSGSTSDSATDGHCAERLTPRSARPDPSAPGRRSGRASARTTLSVVTAADRRAA